MTFAEWDKKMALLDRKIPTRIRKQRFIEMYLNENKTANVLDEQFHDEWHNIFGGKRIGYMWGSAPCQNAMIWLRKLYDQGILDRGIISLREGPEFPKWVYVYTLKGE